MNKIEYLLTCLSEECAEVAQRVSKAQRFGLFEKEPGQEHTNRERISLELADLKGVVEILEEVGAVKKYSDDVLEKLIALKKHKVNFYMNYSRECGALEERGRDG